MTYQSPAIESDVIDTARAQGLPVVYRVICRGPDGAYGRLCHYTDADQVLACKMAHDMAFANADRDALIETIDTATGQAVGLAVSPYDYPKAPQKVATGAQFCESTRTIRSVPENYWLASIDSWDGAPDHDANARIMAASFTMLDMLKLTEKNLGSLIAARHSDAVLMTTWRDEVRKAIAAAEVAPHA